MGHRHLLDRVWWKSPRWSAGDGLLMIGLALWTTVRSISKAKKMIGLRRHDGALQLTLRRATVGRSLVDHKSFPAAFQGGPGLRPLLSDARLQHKLACVRRKK